MQFEIVFDPNTTDKKGKSISGVTLDWANTFEDAHVKAARWTATGKKNVRIVPLRKSKYVEPDYDERDED
jgi:hypothetical protein